MGTIQSGIGLASGLDLSSLIEQMLAADAARKVPLQSRLTQIASARSAIQQISTQLLALRTAAQKFGDSTLFGALTAGSSASSVATASLIPGASGAVAGSTEFLVRALAKASKVVSQGVADPTQALGLSGLTLRFGGGRLLDDRALSLLNGGAGVPRGKIKVTDRAGHQAVVDLRDAVSISDVVRAINSASGIEVEAQVGGADHRSLEVIDQSGGSGTLKVQEWNGGTTASALGLLGSDTDGDGVLTGAAIATLGNTTPLWSLGGGVPIDDGGTDITVVVNGDSIPVALGASADTTRAATLGDAIARINAALSAAGHADATLSIAPQGDRLQVTYTGPGTLTFQAPNTNDPSSALALKALGLDTVAVDSGATQNGRPILFGLDDVGLDRLAGGAGLAIEGTMTITDRAGHVATVTGLDRVDSVQAVIAQIQAAVDAVPGMAISVGLDPSASRLLITDSSAGSGHLTISGDAAHALGLEADVAASRVQSADLARADFGWGSRLRDIAGAPVTGAFQITAQNGQSATISLGPGVSTVSDLAAAISASGLPVTLKLTSDGDGLELVDTSSGAGTLTVTDTSGTPAASLRIAGSSATGDISGTRTHHVDLNGTETLAQVADAINAFGGVNASVVSNGAGGAFLMIAGASTGQSNSIVLTADGADLGLTTTVEARDAHILVAPDAGAGVLVTSATNTITGVIPGAQVDLKSVSDDPVTITLAGDTSPIAAAVKTFASALATAVSQLRSATAVDPDANTKGPLYGDLAATRARDSLRSLLGATFGPSGKRLSSLGITLGSDGIPTLDESKLNDAINADPGAVQATLSGANGLKARFDALLGSIVDPSAGILESDDARLGRISDSTTQRINDIDAAIAKRRERLQTRFAAMEAAIQRLQAQQSALQSLLSKSSS